MAFTLHYDSENQCLMSCLEGEIGLEMIKEFAKRVAQELTKYHCRNTIYDIRRAISNLSTVDIYNLPQIIRETGQDVSCKRALITNNASDDLSFFETVSANQCQIVKIFNKTSDALKWFRKDERG